MYTFPIKQYSHVQPAAVTTVSRLHCTRLRVKSFMVVVIYRAKKKYIPVIVNAVSTTHHPITKLVIQSHR